MPKERRTALIYFPEASQRSDLSLRQGETFEARARWTHQGLVLDFDGHRLPVRADRSVTEGDRLTLHVSAVGHPLELEIVDHSCRLPALQATLRQGIADSGSASGLATAWRAEHQRRKEMHDICQDFLASRPTLSDLGSPQGVEDAIVNSGLFYEHRLAAGRRTEHDLKAAIISQDSVLYHLGGPSGLHRAFRALGTRIASLQAGQLLTVDTAPGWTVELPLQGSRTLHAARLHAQPKENGGWLIELRLDLENLGPVHITLYHRRGRVDAACWASRLQTATHLAAHIDELGALLRQAGFEPGSLACYHGWPATDRARNPTTGRDGLIDEQA